MIIKIKKDIIMVIIKFMQLDPLVSLPLPLLKD